MFSANMQCDRLLFLHWCFSFDGETTRAHCWKQYCFAAAREPFELFNGHCMTSMKVINFNPWTKHYIPYIIKSLSSSRT